MANQLDLISEAMTDQVDWEERGQPTAHGIALRSELGLSLALCGLLVGASLSLARLFATSVWVLPVWLGIAAALALGMGLRRLRVGKLLWLLGMAAGFVLVTGFWLFPETLWVVVPTRATLVAMWEAFVTAITDAREETAPVAVNREFLLLAVGGVWAVTMSAEGLAFRARQPLLALGPALALLVFPAMIRTATPFWYALWFLLGAAGLLLHEGKARLVGWGRWLAHPGVRPGGRWRLPVTPANTTARRLMLGAWVLALGVPWLLPGYGDPALLNYRGQGEGGSTIEINPFVSLRQSLNDDSDLVLFRVESDRSAYWRLLTLDEFDGETWQASALRSASEFQPGDLTADLEAGAPTEELVQHVEIDRLSGAWLPAAPAALDVSGPANFLRNPIHRGMTIDGRWRSGFAYDAVSAAPAPAAEHLRRPQSYPQHLTPYQTLPDVDDYIIEQAVRITDGEPFAYDKALALQDWFREDETFTYDLEATALNDEPDALLAFVRDQRRGYCEQFAASMAVMARAIGIPSRVAVGFTPGSLSDGVYSVTARHAHAWPELWFQGVGWIPFEPTPRADGQVVDPSYTTAIGRQPQTDTPEQTAPGAAATPVPGGEGVQDPALLEGLGGLGFGELEEPGVWERWGWALRILIAVLLVPWLVPAVNLARSAWRRQRGRASPRAGVRMAWAELADWAEDAGVGRAAGETPAAWARRLGWTTPAAAAALEELAGLLVRAAYAARPPAAEDAATARRVARRARAALARELGGRRRVTRVFSVRSLVWAARGGRAVRAGTAVRVRRGTG